MKQAFREKLLKVGVLDTRKYHYEVFSHARAFCYKANKKS